jgi:large-conductance mechanosensitive channel
MTEPQFLAIAGPLLLYILGFLAVAMTIFVYVEFKDRMAKFQTQYRQQCEIDALKKENQELKDSLIAKIRTDLKSVKIA